MNLVKSVVNVGDIFCASWGYEQTNVNFYQVVARTPKGMRVREIKAVIIEESEKLMSGVCKPAPNEWEANAKTYLVRLNGAEYVRIEGQYANKWDGRPMFFSTYG